MIAPAPLGSVAARTLAEVLFVAGYPTAIVCITRLVPVFRQRRQRWFWAHEAGTAAIVAGWVLKANRGAVAINGAWLAAVGVAWAITGRRRAKRQTIGLSGPSGSPS